MHILLASDHAGFELKEELKSFLAGKGHEVEDMGPHALVPGDDYPDYCIPLAKKMAQNKGFFGIVVGHSGQGEAMAANRIPGVRAAVYYGGPREVLTLAREHNDANVLSLGSHFVSNQEACDAVEYWLATSFSGEERHVRRIGKLDI